MTLRPSRFLYNVAVTCLLVFCACHTTHRPEPARSNPRVLAKLHNLLEHKEFFRLDNVLKQVRDSLNSSDQLFFQAQADNAFNRNEACIRGIRQLMDSTAAIPDSASANLLILLGDSYFKTFRYAEAAAADSVLLKKYAAVLDSDRLQDMRDHLLIYSALRHTQPQQVIITDSTTLHWTRDRIGLIEIPLGKDGHNYSSIFDTRANISSISETFAKKLGLRILDVHYNEGAGITGIEFRTGLGVADSLSLGKITLRNVVFQVMPDSILYIAPIHFALNILIGYPVIEQLRQIHLFTDGRMTIPLKPAPGSWHNLALDHLDPVLFLRTDKDTLCFHFDLGASSSQLYSRYFEKYKLEILRQGHAKTVAFGGAGGIQKKSVYVMPSVNFYLGSRKARLDSVDILTQKINPQEMFYGNIGQDFVRLFPELILNFSDMYVEGK